MPLTDRALLVTLSLAMFSPKKTDKRITQQVLTEHRAAAGALRVAKRLLPDQAVELIRKLHADIRDYHHGHTLPWSEDNERLLSSEHFLVYSDWMRQRRTELETAIDHFLQNYPLYIDEARIQLNGAFNQSDYPDPERIRAKFAFRLDYKPVPSAGDFRVSLAQEEMDTLRADLTDRVETAERNARADVARRLAEPLAAMVNRLSDPEGVFRDTLVTNLREICDLLPALNITGDPHLETARQQIRATLYSADPGLLRTNPAIRSSTAGKAQSILDQMHAAFGHGS